MTRVTFAAIIAAVTTTNWISAIPLPIYPSHHGHACLPPNNTFPFCDTTLPILDRVTDLIGRMTLAQKITNRYDRETAIPELGLPDFNYNQEGLHGLGAQCFAANASTVVRCPTIYAAPPGLGSSFNLSLLHAIGSAISDESRAYNNFGGNRGYQNRPTDLVVWLPNINVGLSALWGRVGETYSEDPFVIGALAAAMVDGTQRGAQRTTNPNEGNQYLKTIVGVKHMTGYQMETNRFASNVDLSAHDLASTFYPSWEMVMEIGQATGTMCSYNAINGVPSCANALLINELARDAWGLGQQGGSYVQGDCGALDDISGAHHYMNSNATSGAAFGLNAGVDVDCGGSFTNNLGLAIQLDYTSEAVLDASLTRTYILQMLAGRFDPIESQPYMSIPFEAINSPEHNALAAESAAQGMVLLRNDANLLPLGIGSSSSSSAAYKNIALIGPHANSTGDLLGVYFEQCCPSGLFDCIPTILDAITSTNTAGTTAYAMGVPMQGGDTSGIPAAVATASAADVILLAIGTNSDVQNEGADRPNTLFPGYQQNLTLAILALNKPTVILIFSGGSLAIDFILNATASGSGMTAPVSIIYGFFPGQAGGNAVRDALYGVTNRWGKLPVTMYPLSYTDAMPVTQVNMTGLPSAPYGRTYKYYDGPVLYPFGYGLSYTTFTLSGDCPVDPPSSSSSSSSTATTKKVLEIARQNITLKSRYAKSSLAAATASAAFFPMSSMSNNNSQLPPITCSVTVSNTGNVQGDEVVMVFIVPNSTSIYAARKEVLEKEIAASSSSTRRQTLAKASLHALSITPDPLAIRMLVAFERVTVAANGGQVTVPFNISIESFASVDNEGVRVIWPGLYKAQFQRGGFTDDIVEVEVEIRLAEDEEDEEDNDEEESMMGMRMRMMGTGEPMPYIPVDRALIRRYPTSAKYPGE